MTRSFFVFCALFGSSVFAQSTFTVPPAPVDPITDLAQMMDADTRGNLNTLLRSVHTSGGSQIAVLIVPSLSGVPLEDASLKVADQWKLGRKGKDDGILVLIAEKERSIRIEVGRGREGDFTDAHARRVIANVMVPHFRSGSPSAGIYQGVIEILNHTDPDRVLTSNESQQPPRKKGSLGLEIVIILLVIGLSILRRIFMPRFQGRIAGIPTYGSRRSGGLFGGGGDFGGGGFRGGGGGFGGGGASGKW